MKTSTGATRSIIVIATSFWATPAAAQLWNPLDTVPRPNAIMAHDTSVTMGIEPDCSDCHGAGDPRTRLDQAKLDILQTLPLFRDYFVFGAFEYQGCNYARIVPGTRILPTPANPDSSYNSVYNQIQGAVHCGSSERGLMGGGSTGCITPTPFCAGDIAVIQQIMMGGLSGFTPQEPWANFGCRAPALQAWCPECGGDQAEGGPCQWVGNPPKQPGTWADVANNIVSIPDPEMKNTSTCMQGWCVNPIVNCDAGGSYQVQAALLAKLQSMSWPQWYDGAITGADVQNDLCDPVRQIFDEVANEMRACSADRYVLTPDTSGNWCIPGQIANNACAPGSPLYGTCVCDDSNPLCTQQTGARSACGNLLTWKARQQTAVCEVYDDSAAGRFGSFYQSQSDNVVNPGGCRENVAMFFTDGYMGGTAGTTVEALQAAPTYTSFGGRSNMFVFRVANAFTGDANAMMSAVTRGQINTAYLATDLVNMQVSFARVLNRVYKGVYTGASIGQDANGTRAAFHSFTVPGYSLGAPLGDDYLGWPGRISWHAIDTNGNINPNPIWETDWASKANAASSCGASYTVGGGLNIPALIGPGGNFRNGVSRNVAVGSNLMDRNGDDINDAHVPLSFGRMFSIGATRPIVIDAPRSANEGRWAGDHFFFAQANKMRARMIVTMSNGYVHAFDGGLPTDGNFNLGYAKSSLAYNDTAGSAGAEIFRFAPTWVDDPPPGNSYNIAMNDLVQQPMITGQLTASDVHLRNPANGNEEWMTVLAGAQGREGRGYFTMNVTNPCNARVLGQWVLPNPTDRATNDPIIYTIATNGTPKFRPALIVTGGLGGTSNIYAYDVANGALLFQAGLGGGGPFPTSPICADVTGEERMTHCYVVGATGALKRVELGYNGGFTRVDDITPAGVGGVFSTPPAVFFTANGDPAIVYGSGDHENLTTAGGQNYIYKMVDTRARKRQSGGTANINTACGTVTSPRSGVIPLAPGERVISPPTVAKGLVAWSAYTAVSSGCASGTGALYAMKHDSCDEGIDDGVPPGTAPRPHPTNPGIPSQPMLHRGSQKLMVTSSKGPTAGQTTVLEGNTRGGVRPFIRKAYWRALEDKR